MIKPKCMFRTRLEERLGNGETPVEDKCYSCYGYKTSCPDFIDAQHLLNFVELYRLDKQGVKS